MLAYRRADLKRAILLSGIVGSWLVALNQGGVILDGKVSEYAAVARKRRIAGPACRRGDGFKRTADLARGFVLECKQAAIHIEDPVGPVGIDRFEEFGLERH